MDQYLQNDPQIHKLSSPPILSPLRTRNESLQESINSLNQCFRKGSLNLSKFFEKSRLFLKELTDQFTSKDQFKLWLRYFDVANKVFEISKLCDQDRKFQSGMDNLIDAFLLSPCNTSGLLKLDWRIVKKFLTVRQICSAGSLIRQSEQEYEVIKAIKTMVNETLEYFFWDDSNHNLAQSVLQEFQELLETISEEDPAKEMAINLDIYGETQRVTISQAVVSGRVDKEFFRKTKHTIILGDDGGLFLLLNSITLEEEKLFLEKMMGKEYVRGKEKQGSAKLVIGKGGFVKVRFALNLIQTETLAPNTVICVKKTSTLDVLENEIGKLGIEEITDNVLSDDFTRNISSFVYSPKVLDVAFLPGAGFCTGEHLKGYIMMEIIPQNTGLSVFRKQEGYQKWEYQKPYLLDILGSVNELLNLRVIMTDLKPENTLYDLDRRKGTLIDLAGSLKVSPNEDSTLR